MNHTQQSSGLNWLSVDYFKIIFRLFFHILLGCGNLHNVVVPAVTLSCCWLTEGEIKENEISGLWAGVGLSVLREECKWLKLMGITHRHQENDPFNLLSIVFKYLRSILFSHKDIRY